MSGYLNVESIANAAELVNTTLSAKGYIAQDLKFAVTDWSELIADQPHKDALLQLQVSENIYNNDKNVLNIIYSLTQALDRLHAQHRTFNKTLAQKEATISLLRRDVHQLQKTVHVYESKLDKETQRELTLAEDRARAAQRTARTQAHEIARLKSAHAELQTRYDVEMRKKAAEVALLKDRLLDTRHLSTAVAYGRGPRVDPDVVHYGKPQRSNGAAAELVADDTAPAVGREYEDIATQLSELVEKLLSENGRYAGFVGAVNQYFRQLNGEVSVANRRALAVETLTRPGDVIDLLRVLASAEVEPFENVCRPLLSTIYNNHRCVAGLVDEVVNAPRAGGDGEQLERMREENKVLYDNWNDAVKALEDWKRYKAAA